MTNARTFVVLAAVVLVSGIGIGGVAFALFGDRREPSAPSARTTASPSSASPPSTRTVTETTMAARPRCHDAPRVTVSNVDLTSGGLVLTASFATSCDEGDALTGSAVVLSAAQGGRDFASGTFDLDADPIVLPANGSVERTLVFPAGSFWRGPELVQRSEMTVDVGGASHGDAATASGGSSTLTADRAANPGHGTLEGTAGEALRELANFDRGYVASTLQNYWVPQLSGKRVGTRDDGIVYGPNDILRNHFQLRQRYPNVKLVASGDWSTFDGAGFWVSVVGQPYYSGPLANQWCDQNGIGVDDCFAKVISANFGPEGTTMIRH